MSGAGSRAHTRRVSVTSVAGSVRTQAVRCGIRAERRHMSVRLLLLLLLMLLLLLHGLVRGRSRSRAGVCRVHYRRRRLGATIGCVLRVHRLTRGGRGGQRPGLRFADS